MLYDGISVAKDGQHICEKGKSIPVCVGVDWRSQSMMFANRLAEEKLEWARRYCCLGLASREEGHYGLHEPIATLQGDCREAARRRRRPS